MKRISEYSSNGTLLSIIGGLNIQSEETLFNIFNNVSVKCATTHNVNGEFDYVFIKDDIDSSKYSTGLFWNLYTDHQAVFVRVSTAKNDVYHFGNIEEANEDEENMWFLGFTEHIQHQDIDELPNSDSDTIDNVIDVDTSRVTNFPHMICFDNNRGQNNCWLNSVLQVLVHMLKYVPNEQYQSQNAMINAFMKYLKDITNIRNKSGT